MTAPDIHALAEKAARERYNDCLDPANDLTDARVLDAIEYALAKLQQQHEAERERAYQMLEANGVPRERAKSIPNGIDVLATRFRKAEAERDAAVAEALERAAGIIDARAGICNSNRLAYNDKDCPAATAWADKERMLREEAANIRSLKPRSDLVSVPRAVGVGRDAGNENCICVYFTRSLTDEEMRGLHEALAGRAMLAADFPARAVAELRRRQK